MGMIFTGGPDGAVCGAGALLPQAVLRMINVTPPTTAPACNVEPRIYCGTVTLRLMSPLSTSRVNQALPSLPIGTVREPTGSTTLSFWTAQGAPTSPRNQLRLTRCADCTFHWTVMSCPTTGTCGDTEKSINRPVCGPWSTGATVSASLATPAWVYDIRKRSFSANGWLTSSSQTSTER